jgi:hypothetical protein
MPDDRPGAYSVSRFLQPVMLRFELGEHTLKQSVEQIELPIFTLHLDDAECRFDTADEIADYLKEKIESHKSARYIATFDHLAHTASLPEGQVAEEIHAAINLVFCFGFTLQDPAQLATRPRSIGICHGEDGFTISFVEAPMPVVNALMEEWTQSLSRTYDAAGERHA